MCHAVVYGWVTDEFQIGHICHTWVTRWVRDGWQMNHIGVVGWVTDESYMSHTRVLDGLQMNHGLVTDESKMGLRWVTKNHRLVRLSNIKLTNLWPCQPSHLATFRTWKMKVIFDQSEESNTVVSLTTLL